MPKANFKDNIFILEWTSELLNRDYKLEIFTSHNTDISKTMPSGGFITLPQDCLEDYTYQADKNEFGLGLGDATTMEFTFAYDKCPQYFLEMLFDPFEEYTQNITLDDATTFPITFIGGNVFVFSVKYTDSSNPTTWYNKYIGTQNSGLSWSQKPNEKSIEVITYDVMNTAMTNFDTAYYNDFWNITTTLGIPNFYSHRSYYDWVTTHWWSTFRVHWVGASTRSRLSKAKMRGWYPRIIDIETYTQGVLNIILGKILRNSQVITTSNILLNFDLIKHTKFYKQKYDSTGDQGALLDHSSGETYVLGYIANKKHSSKSSAKLYNGGFFRGIQEEYKNLWDWMKDATIEDLNRPYSSYSLSGGDYSIMTINQTCFNSTTKEIKPQYIEDMEIEYSSEDAAFAVEAVPVEKVAEDIDSFRVETNSKFVKVDSAKNIRITFNNLPLIVARGIICWLNCRGNSAMTNKIHELQVFYKDTSISSLGNRMHRVHEKIDMDLGDSKTGSDYITIGSFEPNHGYIMNYREGLDIDLYRISQESGKPKFIAMLYNYLFGDENMVVIRGKIDARHPNIAGSLPNQPWFELAEELKIDLQSSTDIEPFSGMLDNYSDQYLLRSVTINKDETIEFEAVSRKKATI